MEDMAKRSPGPTATREWLLVFWGVRSPHRKTKSATRADLIFSRHFCQAAGDIINSPSLPPTIVLYSVFPIFSFLKKKKCKNE